MIIIHKKWKNVYVNNNIDFHNCVFNIHSFDLLSILHTQFWSFIHLLIYKSKFNFGFEFKPKPQFQKLKLIPIQFLSLYPTRWVASQALFFLSCNGTFQPNHKKKNET
jgi:hypothetical protein